MATYTLPCGYLDPETNELHREVELREMTGYEEDLLGSQGAKAFNELFSRCLTRLGTLKRTKSEGQARFFVPHITGMTLGDRTFLLIRIRQLSLGNDFLFEATCPQCRHRHPRMCLDLEELEVKEAADPLVREWETTLPSGKEATYRMLTGKDEATLAQAQRTGIADYNSIHLLTRLKTLEGEKPTISKIKQLSYRDRDFLRSEFRQHDSGINIDIEVECEVCQAAWAMELPIGQISFFRPSEIRR